MLLQFIYLFISVLKFSQFQTRMVPSRCRRIWRKYRLWKIFLVMLMPVFAVLHLIVLPSVSGGYNDECYLPDEKRQTLRIMVQNISRAFDQFGVVYWLDYGKLHDVKELLASKKESTRFQRYSTFSHSTVESHTQIILSFKNVLPLSIDF